MQLTEEQRKKAIELISMGIIIDLYDKGVISEEEYVKFKLLYEAKISNDDKEDERCYCIKITNTNEISGRRMKRKKK